MSHSWYNVTYETQVSFHKSRKAQGSGSETAWATITLRLLAEGLTDAIKLSVEALRGLERGNNGKTYPFHSGWELLTAEKDKEQ